MVSKQGNGILGSISLSPFAPENVVPRDGFGRLVFRHPAHSPHRLDLVLTPGFLPDFRGGVHLCIPPSAIGCVSPEFMGSRNCVPMVCTAESPPDQGQSVTCAAFSGITVGLFSRTLFPHPLLVLSGHARYTKYRKGTTNGHEGLTVEGISPD